MNLKLSSPLQEWRQQNGHTQLSLAHATQLSEQMIRQVEQGTASTYPASLAQLTSPELTPHDYYAWQLSERAALGLYLSKTSPVAWSSCQSDFLVDPFKSFALSLGFNSANAFAKAFKLRHRAVSRCWRGAPLGPELRTALNNAGYMFTAELDASIKEAAYHD